MAKRPSPPTSRSASRPAPPPAPTTSALRGDLEIIYNFGQDLIDEHAIEVSAEQVTVPGFSQPLVYKKDARFSDMLD